MFGVWFDELQTSGVHLHINSGIYIPWHIQTKFIHKLYIDNISVEFENYNISERVLPHEDDKTENVLVNELEK